MVPMVRVFSPSAIAAVALSSRHRASITANSFFINHFLLQFLLLLENEVSIPPRCGAVNPFLNFYSYFLRLFLFFACIYANIKNLVYKGKIVTGRAMRRSIRAESKKENKTRGRSLASKGRRAPRPRPQSGMDSSKSGRFPASPPPERKRPWPQPLRGRKKRFGPQAFLAAEALKICFSFS